MRFLKPSTKISLSLVFLLCCLSLRAKAKTTIRSDRSPPLLVEVRKKSAHVSPVFSQPIVSCKGTSAIGSIEFKGKIVTNSKVAKDHTRLIEIAKDQIRFAGGHYPHREMSPGLWYLVPSRAGPDIKIKRQEEITGTRHLSSEKESSVQPDVNLDPIRPMLTEFHATLEVATCFDRSRWDNSVNFILPLQPDQVHKLTSTAKPKAICSQEGEDAELMDPRLSWFFWSPARKVEQRPCSSYLVERKIAYETKGLFKPSGKNETSLVVVEKSGHKEVSVSLVYGWTTGDHPIKNADLNRLKTGLDQLAKGQKVIDRLKDTDPGTQMAFKVAEDLSKKLKVIKADQVITPDHGIVRLVFKNDEKILTLNIFVGTTDFRQNKPTAHLDFLKSSLIQSEFVAYTGPSGYGMNLRDLNPKDKKTDLPFEQVVAIFSHFSYSYFKPEFFWIAKPRRFTFITTGSYTTRSLNPTLEIIKAKMGLPHLLARENLSDIGMSDDFYLSQSITEI